MKTTALIVAVSAGLACVESTGVLLDPPPRPITDDFRKNLPPTLRGLPERDLQKLPNDYVSKKYGGDTAKKFKDFSGPCGGVPRQPGRSSRAALGQPMRFAWNVERGDSNARCKLMLSCPNKSIERILWSGDCRDAKNYSQDVVIPKDVGPCGEGECYVQWSMETKSDKFCNCVDVIVDNPKDNRPTTSSAITTSSASSSSSTGVTSQTTTSVSSSIMPTSSKLTFSSSTQPTSSVISSTTSATMITSTSSSLPSLTSKILTPSSTKSSSITNIKTTSPISSLSSSSSIFSSTSTSLSESSSSIIFTTSSLSSSFFGPSSVPSSTKGQTQTDSFPTTTIFSDKINSVTSTSVCESSMITGSTEMSPTCSTCTSTDSETCSTCTLTSTGTCSTCTITPTTTSSPVSESTSSQFTTISSSTGPQITTMSSSATMPSPSSNIQTSSTPQFTTITSGSSIETSQVLVTVTEKVTPITQTQTVTMVKK